jgi:hypothetical protein
MALVGSGAYAVENEIAPSAIPGGSTGEGTFPILAEISLDMNSHCVGVGFDGQYLWVSAGDQSTGTAMFYVFDDAGTLIDSQPQGGGATGWGHRDMAYDGTYMFGSFSNLVDGFLDPATFSGFFTGPISPCRAMAYDGSDFYTGGFSENLWKLTWDGTWGTTASTENLGGPWDGTYGLAYNRCTGNLYMTTADYSGNLHEVATDGFLLNTYTTLPEYDIQGGCTMADCSYGYILVVLQQSSPDMLTFYDVGTPSPVEDASWGEIKSLFQ